jgi:hypothetical protein
MLPPQLRGTVCVPACEPARMTLNLRPTPMRLPLLTLACFVSFAYGTLAFAQQSSTQQAPPKPPEGQEGSQERRGPPPEALAACKSLTAGAACNFTSPRGAETGTCFAPEGRPLACRPKYGPGGPGGQQDPASSSAAKPKPAN